MPKYRVAYTHMTRHFLYVEADDAEKAIEVAKYNADTSEDDFTEQAVDNFEVVKE